MIFTLGTSLHNDSIKPQYQSQLCKVANEYGSKIANITVYVEQQMKLNNNYKAVLCADTKSYKILDKVVKAIQQHTLLTPQHFAFCSGNPNQQLRAISLFNKPKQLSTKSKRKSQPNNKPNILITTLQENLKGVTRIDCDEVIYVDAIPFAGYKETKCWDTITAAQHIACNIGRHVPFICFIAHNSIESSTFLKHFPTTVTPEISPFYSKLTKC